jgi:hypothetical protein
MLLATDESANVMVKRDTAMQPRELYVHLISCAWIAACVALYFLVAAIFYHSSWWDFFWKCRYCSAALSCFAVLPARKRRRLAGIFLTVQGAGMLGGVMSEPTIPDVELIDNTSQRLPCILLLDASRSIADSLRDRMNADSFI